MFTRGQGKEEMGCYCFMGAEFQCGMTTEVLEMDGGDEYTIIYYVYFTLIKKYQQNKMSTWDQTLKDTIYKVTIYKGLQ